MGDLFGPRGLPQAERDLVIQDVASRSRLVPESRQNFKLLLAERGRDMFPESSSLTMSEVHKQLRVVRDLPAMRDGWPQIEPWPLTLAVPGGRIELLGELHVATFQPLKGNSVKISGPLFVDENEKSWWSYVPIAEEANQIQKSGNGKVTAVQLGAFAADCRSAPVGRSSSAQMGHFGGVYIKGTLMLSEEWPKSILIDREGRVTHVAGYASIDPDAFHAAPPPPPSPPPAPPTPERYSASDMWVLSLESLVSMLVSLTLVIPCLLLFFRRRSAILWTRAYAYAQTLINIADLYIGVRLASTIYAMTGLPEPDPRFAVYASFAGFLFAMIVPSLMYWVTRGQKATAFLT